MRCAEFLAPAGHDGPGPTFKFRRVYQLEQPQPACTDEQLAIWQASERLVLLRVVASRSGSAISLDNRLVEVLKGVA